MGLGAMGARHARVLSAMPDRFEVVGGPTTCNGATGPRASPGSPPRPKRSPGPTSWWWRRPSPPTRRPSLAPSQRAGMSSSRSPSAHPTATPRPSSRWPLAAAARLFVGPSERFNPVVRALARLTRGADVVALDLEQGRTHPAERRGRAREPGRPRPRSRRKYLGGGGVSLRGAVASHDSADVLFGTAVRERSATSTSIAPRPPVVARSASRRGAGSTTATSSRTGSLAPRADRGEERRPAPPRRAAGGAGSRARGCPRRRGRAARSRPESTAPPPLRLAEHAAREGGAPVAEKLSPCAGA